MNEEVFSLVVNKKPTQDLEEKIKEVERNVADYRRKLVDLKEEFAKTPTQVELFKAGRLKSLMRSRCMGIIYKHLNAIELEVIDLLEKKGYDLFNMDFKPRDGDWESLEFPSDLVVDIEFYKTEEY